MKNYVHKSNYFYGNEISEEEIKKGYINYRTLAKCFDAILCNDITKLFYSTINNEYTEVEQVNGYIDNSEEIDKIQEQIDELESNQPSITEDSEQYLKIQEQIDALQERIDELEQEQDEQQDIYQYYIISNNGASILQELTDDPVFYLPSLDIYIWGVTHFGTSWSGVFTNIKIELNGEV